MQISVSDYIVATLIEHGVKDVFGVISIHNLPIADAIGQSSNLNKKGLNFIPARGEAGSAAMADTYGRLNGLGVALTSTGAGAGNAVGALLEALNAGTPLLHITGQVECAYLDRSTGFIHETKDQLSFLKAACKSAYRIVRPEQIQGILAQAIADATTYPKGPVSIEIPIDLQLTKFTPAVMPYHPPVYLADPHKTQQLATLLNEAVRPIIWVGGGAKHCSEEIQALADLGIAVISSTHGRGILSDKHPRSLRAHHNHAAVHDLIKAADVMLVIGSKLRSNETASYSTQLSQKVIQIDVDAQALQRNYPIHVFLQHEAKSLLRAALGQVTKKWLNAEYDQQILKASARATEDLREAVGAYAALNDFILALMGEKGLFVRDITISGSTWGSRLLECERPVTNLHSLAGAIGLGLPHAIGASIAKRDKRVVAIVGDGGIALNIGEMATLAQEQLNLCVIVMNDGGYGVMRGIQDKYFAGRQYYNQLSTPDFKALANAYGIRSFKVHDQTELQALLETVKAINTPVVIEIMMTDFGPLKFAGPPQKKLY